MSDLIKTSRDGIVVTITIDRPERKNALSVDAINGLTDAWARVEADRSARVVVLTSSDCGVFSAGLDLKQAAEIRARDGVDILVDLKGYTLNARSRILALRPAPVQVNWLGYPGSMGADCVDYILADPFIIPEGAERHYS